MGPPHMGRPAHSLSIPVGAYRSWRDPVGVFHGGWRGYASFRVKPSSVKQGGAGVGVGEAILGRNGGGTEQRAQASAEAEPNLPQVGAE
jgi:hypothetical protein